MNDYYKDNYFLYDLQTELQDLIFLNNFLDLSIKYLQETKNLNNLNDYTKIFNE